MVRENLIFVNEFFKNKKIIEMVSVEDPDPEFYLMGIQVHKMMMRIQIHNTELIKKC
jgi:hypothetical protein